MESFICSGHCSSSSNYLKIEYLAKSGLNNEQSTEGPAFALDYQRIPRGIETGERWQTRLSDAVCVKDRLGYASPTGDAIFRHLAIEIV